MSIMKILLNTHSEYWKLDVQPKKIEIVGSKHKQPKCQKLLKT